MDLQVLSPVPVDSLVRAGGWHLDVARDAMSLQMAAPLTVDGEGGEKFGYVADVRAAVAP